MSRWKSKACPRCGGDMFVDRDLETWYEQCLQCSYRMELKELKPIAPVNEQAMAEEKGSRKREKIQHAS